MAKKKTLTPLLYLASIVFLPSWIPLLFTKILESRFTHFWNIEQPETFLNDIEKKTLLAKFIELEELLLLDEMLNDCPKMDLQTFLHKETIQLVKMSNDDHIHKILHFSTSIISWVILGAWSILCKEELVILNSWVKEFLYNLSDTLKAFCILFLIDYFLGFHSNPLWAWMLRNVYKSFGLVPTKTDLFFAFLNAILPAILDVSCKYCFFRYFNTLSPSLIAVFGSLTD
uniref:Chloroplast envelope membrane protein n=1 Tax=Monsonia speciosa TaxID=163694 RepID=B7T3P4_9ROSI|nr:chloroplast envelope membrane protein [Monsonia speciosa]ACH47660.1 chloroplast envelope membrane protein [Monsonia speciosa]ADJ66464.1 chloroplast envelope membrane protein [Monsonia speciosa]